MKILKRNCVCLCIKISWKESVSAKTDGPVGISVLWRDWGFVQSEAKHFISASFSLLEQPFLTPLFINNLQIK